jgi:6-phosphogluconolactonase
LAQESDDRVSVQIEVLDDPAAACAAVIVDAARGGGQVVLTGGSTPRAAYEQAASADVDWVDATVWFSDERCVSPEDQRSNYGMVQATLIDRVDPAPTVIRMRGELGPAAAAEDYEQELVAAGIDRFDLVLLGVGPDGHVASLFPDRPELDARSRRVVGVEQAGLEPFVPRVSLTLPTLQRARQIVCLVTGEAKAGAVAAAFGPDARPDRHVPASLLAEGAEHVTVLTDRAAAALL